jgi:hypothetical protein
MAAKTLAVGLAVVLMMVGGAAAVTAGPAAQSHAQTQVADTGMNATAPGDADIGATYDNGTVTVTVTQGGEPVENASVEIDEEEYTTDANGTVVAESDGNASLEIEAETGGFEGEVKYKIANNSLLIHEEEYEYKYEEKHEYEEDYENEDGKYEEEHENEQEYENGEMENEQEHEYEDEQEHENDEMEDEQEHEYEDEQEHENDEMEDDAEADGADDEDESEDNDEDEDNDEQESEDD